MGLVRNTESSIKEYVPFCLDVACVDCCSVIAWTRMTPGPTSAQSQLRRLVPKSPGRRDWKSKVRPREDHSASRCQPQRSPLRASQRHTWMCLSSQTQPFLHWRAMPDAPFLQLGNPQALGIQHRLGYTPFSSTSRHSSGMVQRVSHPRYLELCQTSPYREGYGQRESPAAAILPRCHQFRDTSTARLRAKRRAKIQRGLWPEHRRGQRNRQQVYCQRFAAPFPSSLQKPLDRRSGILQSTLPRPLTELLLRFPHSGTPQPLLRGSGPPLEELFSSVASSILLLERDWSFTARFIFRVCHYGFFVLFCCHIVQLI